MSGQDAEPEWGPTWTHTGDLLIVGLGRPGVDYRTSSPEWLRFVAEWPHLAGGFVALHTTSDERIFAIEIGGLGQMLTTEGASTPLIVLPSWGSTGQIFLSFGTYEPTIESKSPFHGDGDPVSVFWGPGDRIVGFEIADPRRTLADGELLNFVFD